MIVVSDTSPLLNLGAIDKLDLLPALYETIRIPASVAAELERNGFQTAPHPWLQITSARDLSTVRELLTELDPGEAEAIVVAIEQGADLLLMDERKGRRIATARGLQVTGLLGVLAEAKRRGLIARCADAIDELRTRAGFWIGKEIQAKFLSAVGE